MNDRKIVVVTGAAGFIGSQVVCRLLEQGHRVRGTVRDPNKTKELAHLRQLPGAAERLELARADLLEPGAFDEVVSGADFVLHTASPYVIDVKDPQKDLVDPALKGTLNVLESCGHAPGVKRVVLTSSVAAITDEPEPGHVLTERDWNTKSSLERNPYWFSKVMAERAASGFVEEHRPAWDLVVINPFIVIGPSLSPGVNQSNQLFVDLLKGTYPGVMNLVWGFVDVRDVAEAHVRAMQVPTAKGRYLCANQNVNMRELVELLAQRGYSGYALPSRGLDCALGDYAVKMMSYLQPKGVGVYLRTNVGRIPLFDNTKIRRDLGIEFRDVHQTILETMDDLKKWGHLGRHDP